MNTMIHMLHQKTKSTLAGNINTYIYINIILYIYGYVNNTHTHTLDLRISLSPEIGTSSSSWQITGRSPDREKMVPRVDVGTGLGGNSLNWGQVFLRTFEAEENQSFKQAARLQVVCLQHLLEKSQQYTAFNNKQRTGPLRFSLKELFGGRGFL